MTLSMRSGKRGTRVSENRFREKFVYRAPTGCHIFRGPEESFFAFSRGKYPSGAGEALAGQRHRILNLGGVMPFVWRDRAGDFAIDRITR